MIQPTSSAFRRYIRIAELPLSTMTVHSQTTTPRVERHADVTAKWQYKSPCHSQTNKLSIFEQE